MPIDYTKYNTNWFTEIRPAALQRANHRCENCGVKDRIIGYRDQSGRFIECDDFMQQWAKNNGIRVFKIILTISHQNHMIEDNRPENLKALCQKCHLKHDQEQHIISRKINAARKRDQRK